MPYQDMCQAHSSIYDTDQLNVREELTQDSPHLTVERARSKSRNLVLIEYSENKIVGQTGLFENEIGPGVLKSSVQKTCFFARVPKAQSRGKESMFRFSRFCLEFLLEMFMNASPTSFSIYVIILFSKCSIIDKFFILSKSKKH